MLPNDNNLIYRYLDGDENSFSLIVDTYLKSILNFSYKLVGNKKDAEDITQEVFLKVWKSLKKFDIEKSFKTWIFAIARNTCIDFLRKKNEIPFSKFDNEEGDNILEDNLIDKELLPDEVFVGGENKKLIEDVLSKLSFIQKEVIILRYMNDLNFNEISEILNIPLNTIKSHHNRALIKMKGILSATI
ncbi:MAG: RNA polymerase sigma factor [Candidatus Paceibacterota bacterium]|jgi:RNA polymerase sigma-70 factor (ECF subfamily)